MSTVFEFSTASTETSNLGCDVTAKNMITFTNINAIIYLSFENLLFLGFSFTLVSSAIDNPHFHLYKQSLTRIADLK